MTNKDTQTEGKAPRRFTISKGCIMMKNNEKRPMVKIQWREGNKTMCKSFSIGKRRNQEQAMEEAKKYYDEKVKPKYDEWKVNYDKETKEIKKEKKRNWKKTPFKCECGVEIIRSSKARHMKSNTHIKKNSSKQTEGAIYKDTQRNKQEAHDDRKQPTIQV